MEQRKMIAKFKDGSIIKGTSRDFSSTKASFHMKSIEGGIFILNVADLKAIFFVKEFDGNRERKKEYKDVRIWDGKKVQVEFTDGEVITGYTMHYNVNRPGFFLIPGDLQSNNEEIYVITSAIKDVTFL